MTDIDIDFLNRDPALKTLPHIKASNIINGKMSYHPGIYVQDIPVDPVSGCASLTYQEAGALGYFKLDFLNNSAYAGIRDAAHLDALRLREPPWELLEDAAIVDMLPHIHGYHAIVCAIKPTSISDLAVVLALIRPGKNRLLLKTRAEIDNEIWLPTDSYFYKKSHAVAFATSIVVRLNLLVEEAEQPEGA